MKKAIILLSLIAISTISIWAQQTMWVCVGNVKYAYLTETVGKMPYDAEQLSVLGKTYRLSEVDSIIVNNDAFDDDNILVTYNGNSAEVKVAGNIASHITASVNGAHVAVLQDATVESEYIYTLQGSTGNGSFYQDGSYKMTLLLNGVSITNPDSAAINIRDGKRIAIELIDGTVNNLVDGKNGKQKGCFAVKGHSEIKGTGTLNITGNSSHAFWGKEYVELKKTTGNINILGAVGDGFNVNQYISIKGGNVTVKNVGDDAMQVTQETDDAGNVIDDVDNTGEITVSGGTLDFATSGDAAKGFKVATNYVQSGGTVTVTQTGSLVASSDDLSYVTAVKADKDITITGGSLTVNNTADGGKGLSANGNITIDETAATTTINITADGNGGTAENVNTGGGSTEPAKSYKVYVSKPGSTGGFGGTSAWSKVYLYKSDGTLVQELTQTVSKSSGYSTITFYVYDFKSAEGGSYYFKSDNYTSRNTTYTIRSSAFTAPTSGSDVYYSISSSYSTSGTTRTYTLSNVTSSYGGTSDTSEDNGTAYNAAGIKADGNITLNGGTVTVKNKGEMSKSIKSKATVTVGGGNITLTPSGAMKVINSDASYSTGIKAQDFVQNAGTLTINNSGAAGKGVSANAGITTNGGVLDITVTGAGQTGTNSASYTAKCLKSDGNTALNAGTITLKATGTGGKGIKVNGTYTQGNKDTGEGPTLNVSTSGAKLGGSTSGGGFGGPGGGGSSSGSSSKGIKVMGTAYVYGGESEITTTTDGAEGLESKTAIYIEGGKHYLKCYDDCINSSGNIYFNGGVTVCYGYGNDAVDSNAGRTGAITIGNGVVFAYTTKASPEEGLDCDNNSYIQITGTGIAISAGGAQGGGGGSSTISGAKQGYNFYTSSIAYTTGRYYTLADASGNNLVTYSFEANANSTLALFTATGMKSGSTYNVKYSTSAPTNATTAWHGLYLGSNATGTTSVCSFTAK